MLHSQKMLIEARTLLRMIADGDLSSPVPRCGRLLRTLKDLGLVRAGEDGEAVLVVTTAGRASL